MDEKHELKKEEIIPLNNGLMSEMFLQELETRLETDPLVPNGLLNLMDGATELMDGCICDNGSIYAECICNNGSIYVS